MNINQSFFSDIPADALVLNAAETAARLKTARGFTNDKIRQCEKNLRNSLSCRYCAIRVPVSYPSENKIKFDFAELESRSLFINLKGCREAFIFAVTTGMGVDRLLARLNVTSPAEHFITDALASAFAEAACDFADNEIKGSIKCRPRFSPGYGDLPLEIQPEILKVLNAQKLLGITLGKSLLMSPMKSITAIMGIENE